MRNASSKLRKKTALEYISYYIQICDRLMQAFSLDEDTRAVIAKMQELAQVAHALIQSAIAAARLVVKAVNDKIAVIRIADKKAAAGPRRDSGLQKNDES